MGFAPCRPNRPPELRVNVSCEDLTKCVGTCGMSRSTTTFLLLLPKIASSPALATPCPSIPWTRRLTMRTRSSNVTAGCPTSLSVHCSGASPARPPPWRLDVAPHLVTRSDRSPCWPSPPSPSRPSGPGATPAGRRCPAPLDTVDTYSGLRFTVPAGNERPGPAADLHHRRRPLQAPLGQPHRTGAGHPHDERLRRQQGRPGRARHCLRQARLRGAVLHRTRVPRQRLQDLARRPGRRRGRRVARW